MIFFLALALLFFGSIAFPVHLSRPGHFHLIPGHPRRFRPV